MNSNPENMMAKKKKPQQHQTPKQTKNMVAKIAELNM